MAFGIGFGSGMLREQDRITNNRMQFASQMAQLIAQNPDLDVNGLMTLVNGAAGTDNTLRGVFTPKTLTPYVEGRDRSRQEQKEEKARATRLQTLNAMQNWLQANPGASVADAQNAYYALSGGVGGADPQTLQMFTGQIQRNQELEAQRKKDAEVGKVMQYRGQFEQDADRLLAENDYDPYKAQVAWEELYGSDNMYGWKASNYITEERATKLRNARIANIVADIEKTAGENDYVPFLDLKYPDLKGPEKAAVTQALDGLKKQRDQEKAVGLNAKVSDLPSNAQAATLAANSKANPEVAFESFVYGQLGMSSKEAQAKGVNIQQAKSLFDQNYKAAQEAYTKKAEEDALSKKTGITDFWFNPMNSQVVIDAIRKGDRAGLIVQIMKSAADRGATGYTQTDANALINDILVRAEIGTSNQFGQKKGEIEGKVISIQDDISKKSKATVDAMFKEKAAYEALGLKDPSMAGIFIGLSDEIDFSNPTVVAKVREITSAWSQGGGGDTNKLISAIRESVSGTDGDISFITDTARQKLERDSGRFGLDKPQTADEFRTSFSASVDEDVEDLAGVIEEARGLNIDDPEQLKKAIATLSRAKSAIADMRGELRNELLARSKNTDWLKLGETVDQNAYSQMFTSAVSALAPYEKQIDQLLTSFAQKAATIQKTNTPPPAAAGMNMVPSKLPDEVQQGYQPDPEYTPDAGSPFMRGVQSIWNSISNTQPIYGGKMNEIATYHGGRAAPLGGFRSQEPEMVPIHKAITDILNNPSNREYIIRNPQAMALIDPNSDAYDPEAFVQMWGNAQNTRAAPPQQ